MINIRFHIVSIIAVFLALAIGILTGTTLLDRATIDVLEARQRSLDDRNDSLRDENAELKAGIERDASFSEELEDRAVPSLVAGDLEGETVLVVASRGIDEPAVRSIETQLAIAGAASRGVLWFDEDLDLADEEEMSSLGEQLEISGEPDAVASKLLARLADELAVAMSDPVVSPTGDATAEPGAGDTDGSATDGSDGVPIEEPAGDAIGGDGSTGSADGTAPAGDDDGEGSLTASDRSVIDDLIASNRLDWDNPDEQLQSPITGQADGIRLLLISGEGARLVDEDFADQLAQSLITRARGVLVGEIHRPRDPADEFIGNSTPDRGVFVDPIRDSASMAARSITLDNLDTEEGRLALLLAISAIETDDNGSYGAADTAEARYPDGPR